MNDEDMGQERDQMAAPPTGAEKRSAFLLLLALTVMVIATAASVLLVNTRHYLIPAARVLAQHGWVRDRLTMDVVLRAGLLLPAGLLVGLTSGRRYRWLASTPALLWLLLCWGNSAKTRKLWPADDLRGQLLFAALWPVAVALACYVLALLGTRLAGVRALRVLLASLLGLGYVWLGTQALSAATLGTGEILGLIAGSTALSAALVVTADEERRIARQTTRFVLAVLCGTSASLDLATIAATGTVIIKDAPGLLGAIAAAVALLGVVWLLIRYRRTGTGDRAPTPSAGG